MRQRKRASTMNAWSRVWNVSNGRSSCHRKISKWNQSYMCYIYRHTYISRLGSIRPRSLWRHLRSAQLSPFRRQLAENLAKKMSQKM